MAAVISVIIPAYNATRYIRDALASLQQQTLQAWEAIVVDDGSTDDTAAIVRQIASTDSRILLLQQTNAGEASARAAGVARATSDLIYFLDADDVALPDALERLTHVLLHAPDAVAVYGDYLRMNAQGALLFPEGRSLGHMPRPQGDIVAALLEQPLFTIGAVAVRKQYLHEADIKVDTNYAEDWVMWVRLALKGNFLYLSGAPLMKYRLHGNNQTHEKVGVSMHKKAIEIVFSIPVLRSRIAPPLLAKLQAKREAFCFFSLGCKELRRADYKQAAAFFKSSIRAGYRTRPAVWLIYLFAKIGWLPGQIKRHLG